MGISKLKIFLFSFPFFFFCWSSWVTAYIIVFSHFISKRHSKGGPISEIVHTGTWKVYWIVFLIWYWCSFFLFKLIELRAYGSIYMSTDSSIFYGFWDKLNQRGPTEAAFVQDTPTFFSTSYRCFHSFPSR